MRFSTAEAHVHRRRIRQDMIALITAFSGRVHGLRGQINHQKRQTKKAGRSPATTQQKRSAIQQEIRGKEIVDTRGKELIVKKEEKQPAWTQKNASTKVS
ncbi:MAG: hypothetical protein ACE5OZ_24980 [Candidatus Heimdallarchaeota archaeon]